MFRRMFGLIVWAAMLAVAGHQYVFKPWRKRWLAGPDDSARTLPGDGLVPEPQFDQTMALTIAAPPSAIWPWLLQMGYQRAGWYSYDAIDMLGHSSREIRPEMQDLHVGQVVPIGPGIGFRVAVVEPERALVLFGDSRVIEEQERDASEAETARQASAETPGLKFVGALSDANMSEFQVSWAFVLDPLGDGRTRLLERFRTRTVAGPAAAIVTPIIDVGHFLMTRKHMLGIRQRAEQLAAERSAGELDIVVSREPVAVPA